MSPRESPAEVTPVESRSHLKTWISRTFILGNVHMGVNFLGSAGEKISLGYYLRNSGFRINFKINCRNFSAKLGPGAGIFY